MTITTDELARYVGADPTDPHVAASAAAANDLVTRHVNTATVPGPVLALAAREVGADIFHRRQTRNGVAGFDAAGDVQPVRITRDPLRAAYDILRPYLTPGIAG